MKKERKIIMLTSKDNYSELYMSRRGVLVSFVRTNPLRLLHEGYTGRHLYIVSDEIVNKGDWMIDEGDLTLHQCISDNFQRDSFVKVIATTNRELGQGDEYGGFYQLPDIPNDFIKFYTQAYNLKVVIKTVLVDYTIKGTFFTPCSCDGDDKTKCAHFDMCDKDYDTLSINNNYVNIESHL